MVTPKANDANFPVKIESSMKSAFLVESVTGEEHLGKPFVFNVNLLSEDQELHFDKVVGQKVCLILELLDGKRFFHGHITEFSYAPPREGFASYQATLRPWYWFLTQTADCRIFQEMSVPDIIKQVFQDNGMVDFTFQLNASYKSWDYCVQYRESDFNFVSRLMEQEGIYYYFEHHRNKHMMMIVDDPSLHKPYPGHEKVSYSIHPDHEDRAGNLDFWTATQSVTPSKYAVQDFNFKTPKVSLLSKFTMTNQHDSPLSDPEIFDYPGEYSLGSEGSDYAKIRLQELQCQQERRQAGGTCRGIALGHTFELENHFRADQNQDYLVVSIMHNLSNAAFLTTSTQLDDVYRCQIEVVKKLNHFRTARHTPKPMVQGPQSAIVVGPEGDEIYTDEYGRVKVQFHWDREGKSDAKSSCWIRVSQLWAGDKWGAIHIPRIGQEVIVSFMEGDPDQPVITGRVYNADQMPPYTLPDNKTQSGIKSRSSKEGTAEDFNEFRFEDKKGEEEIYLHAQHNLTTVVENDEDRKTINTRQAHVGDADNKRPSETIESLVVQGKRLITIYGDDGLTVLEGDNGRKVDIQDGNYELLVEKADYILTVDKGNSTTEVKTGNISTEASKGNISTEASKGNISIEAKVGKIALKAAQEITMTVGPSSIKIDNSGITIKGGMINIEGTGMLEAKSPMTTIKGDAMTTIKGGIVLIN